MPLSSSSQQSSLFRRGLPFALVLLFVFSPYLNISFSPPSTPGIRGLAIVGMGFLSLMLLSVAKKSPELKPIGWLIIGGWLLLSACSLLVAPTFFTALIRQSEWYLGLVLFLLIGMLVREDLLTLCRTYIIVLIGAGLTFITVLLVVWQQLDDPRSHDWFGSPFPFAHIRFYGYLAMSMALAGCYLAAFRGRLGLWVHPLAIVVLSILLGGVFWSGGRGALLGFLAGVITILVCSERAMWRPVLGYLILALPIGYFLSTLFWVEHTALGVSLNHGEEVEDINQLSSGRLGIWHFALTRLLEQPLLGWGPDGYDQLPGKPQATGQPHGMILQAMIDWGIPGGLLFLGTLAWIAIRLFFQGVVTKFSAEQAVLLGIIAAILTHGLTDGTLYHEPSLAVFLVALPLVYWGTRMEKVEIAKDVSRPRDDTESSLPRQRIHRIPTHSWISLIAVLTLSCSILGAIHLFNIRNQLNPVTPLPDSLQANVLRTFPTYLRHLDSWIREWHETSPAVAMEWTKWAQQHSDRAWLFFYLEAEYLEMEGDIAGSEKAKAAGDALRPRWSWAEFNQYW